MDTAGAGWGGEEGEGRTNGESNVGIYSLLCVKQRTSEKALYRAGSSAQCSVMT